MVPYHWSPRARRARSTRPHRPCHRHLVQQCGQPRPHHLPRGPERVGPPQGQGWSTGPQGPGHPARGPRNPSPVLEASCSWRTVSAACQLVTAAAGWVGGEGSFRPKARSACPHETRPHCASRRGHPSCPGTRCRWNAPVAQGTALGGRSGTPTLSPTTENPVSNTFHGGVAQTGHNR